MKSFLNLFCLFTLFSVSTIAFGQKTLVSLGGNVVVPKTYDLNRLTSTSIGGSLRLEISFGKHIYGIATVEYLKFAEKKSDSRTVNFTAIPIQVGIKYYKEERVAKGFFISAEAGIMPSTTNFTYASGNPDFKFKESGLSIAPGIGYQLRGVEASLRPQFNLNVSGYNVYYLNFRLAYALLK